MQKTIVILSHVTFDDSPYCVFVHNHAKALVDQGHKVIVLAIIHWFPILSHFQKYKKDFMSRINGKNKIQIIDGVEVIYKKVFSVSNFLYNSPINLNGFLYYNSIKKEFKKIYKKENIVFIDAHTFKVEGYAAYKLKKKYPKIFTTVTLHGTSFFRNTKTKNGKKQIFKILNKVDNTICVSEKIKKISEDLKVENAKVIFNGIRQYNFDNVEKDKHSIISVGTLIPRKNFDITINAVKELSKKYSDIKLTIVGVGAEKEKLYEMVVSSKLEKKIIFKNQIPNKEVFELMNKNEIFILPSIAEGFGIVYAEAMQARCITIGTKGEGVDGFIKNGYNGFLVNPNVEEITKLISEIFAGNYDIEKITENGYKSVKELTWVNNAKAYLKLFSK